MPNYWGKQMFSIGSLPKVGQKQKKENKDLNVGNNNCQLLIANATSGGARKAAWANFKKLLIFLHISSSWIKI